jgi:hypothetical protein
MKRKECELIGDCLECGMYKYCDDAEEAEEDAEESTEMEVQYANNSANNQ